MNEDASAKDKVSRGMDVFAEKIEAVNGRTKFMRTSSTTSTWQALGTDTPKMGAPG